MTQMPQRSTEALLAKKAELVRKNKVGKAITPSQYAFPSFMLCPPVYADTKIPNNPWMDSGIKIDREKFMAQWFNFYTVLSSNALVYLVTPVKGLQDQTYLNSAVYLPHLKKNDVIILSNFTAPGRAGEEVMAGELLKSLGYQVFQCPHRFESEPELKFLHDNIYLGGYGIRTDIKALQWIRDQFEAKIIPLRETDKKLYHLDCSVFPLTKEDTMICTAFFTDDEIKRVEKVTNIVSVSKNAAYFGICNSLKLDDMVYNASNLLYLKKGDEEYTKERAKNDELEKITRKLGLEVIYFDLSECEKQGAYLSCFCCTLSNASHRV